MRTGAAAAHVGYLHEAAYYDSDAQLLDIVVPFLRGGLDAGEPTVVALGEAHSELVRNAMPRSRDIYYMPGGELYSRPAPAIHAYRRLLAEYVAAGAGQIRLLGELDPTAFGPAWDWWSRYESAVNHAYGDYPLWSLCAYHTGTTPPAVLADVSRTHPWVAAPDDRHEVSPDFVNPVAFLSQDRIVVPDPLQRQAPVVELADPLPYQARAAVLDAAPHGMAPSEVDAFLTAVSEAVTNAIRHGSPPVLVRLWVGDDRVVVTVTDRGPGIENPFAGLIRANGGDLDGGLGLWLCHHLCSHVVTYRDGAGFTIRLTGGGPA